MSAFRHGRANDEPPFPVLHCRREADLKVAIFARGFAGWGGGVDFLRVLCGALAAVGDANRLEFTLVLPGDGPLCRIAALQAMLPGIVRSLSRARRPVLNWPGVPDLAALRRDFADIFPTPVCTLHVDSGRRPVARLLRRIRADVAFPVMRSLGPSFPVPWVGYLPDFQHRYFPKLFTPAQIAQREEEFDRMLREARVVIVNARAVATDVANFYPQARARVVALPFAPAVDPEWLLPRPELLGPHAVRAPYFLVSNQFWTHKGHATAIEAFEIVAARHANAMLVCTGDTSDHRDPGHFGRLTARIEAAGLASRIRILGRIPKREQIEIMKGAHAVLQPTSFEGGPGGGAVYDAVSLGVPAIVSDIPVNLEIDLPGVSFFRAGDARHLADRMSSALAASPQPRPDAETLRAAGVNRRERLGTAILGAIGQAIG